MVKIETPLHPRIHKMLEAISQRGEGSSGLRDEDESWNVIHHCGIGADTTRIYHPILRQSWDLILGSVL